MAVAGQLYFYFTYFISFLGLIFKKTIYEMHAQINNSGAIVLLLPLDFQIVTAYF
jgi:hypothetical protein